MAMGLTASQGAVGAGGDGVSPGDATAGVIAVISSATAAAATALFVDRVQAMGHHGVTTRSRASPVQTIATPCRMSQIGPPRCLV
jgi:hypothetical protein